MCALAASPACLLKPGLERRNASGSAGAAVFPGLLFTDEAKPFFVELLLQQRGGGDLLASVSPDSNVSGDKHALLDMSCSSSQEVAAASLKEDDVVQPLVYRWSTNPSESCFDAVA